MRHFLTITRTRRKNRPKTLRRTIGEINYSRNQGTLCLSDGKKIMHDACDKFMLLDLLNWNINQSDSINHHHFMIKKCYRGLSSEYFFCLLLSHDGYVIFKADEKLTIGRVGRKL